MFRSYLYVAAMFCLAAAVGCSSSGEATGGSGGVGGGTGGDGGGGGGGQGGTEVSATISVGCTNTVTTDVSILDWEMSIDPGAPVGPSEQFTADIDGLAFFAESFLDAALVAIPGIKRAALVDFAGTVLPRSGATGDPVVLELEDIPFTCFFDDPVGSGNFLPCDPANDADNGGNSDCVPPNFGANKCLRWVSLPTTDGVPNSDGGCTPAGGAVPDCDCSACAALNPCTDGTDCKTTQCEANGYCITGPLPVPLEGQQASYTSGTGSEMLFGWDDQNTGATIKADGAYDLPEAISTNPVEPNGLRVDAGLQVALQCTMAVDSGGPDGVAVCSGGSNDGQPCESPFDNSNDSCVGGANDGNVCDGDSDCPDGECVNADCGAGASCGPTDQASRSPNSALISIPIVGGGTGGTSGSGGNGGNGGNGG